MSGRRGCAVAMVVAWWLAAGGAAFAQTSGDRDRDGVSDAQDLCPDEAETRNRVADSDGCPDADGDGDRVADDFDQCPDRRETYNGYRDADGCPDGPEAHFRGLLWGILFDTGQHSLGPAAEGRVREAATYFQENPDIGRVTVVGYTDNRGSRADNARLSQRRADTVRDALVRLGVTAARLSSRGLGERPGDHPEVRQANRRADFTVFEERVEMRAGGHLRPYLGQYTGGRAFDLHVGALSEDVTLTVRPGAPRWLGPVGTTLDCYHVGRVGDRLIAHCQGVISEATVVLVRQGSASRGWALPVSATRRRGRPTAWTGVASCDAGFHLCGGGCSSDDDPVTCGVACVACPGAAHAQPTCENGSCALACDAGFHPCGGSCVSDDDPAHCGPSCEPCPNALAGAEATCGEGRCGLRCRAGYDRRGPRCEPRVVEELIAGTARTFARLSDGTLWAWGWNRDGQLGDGTETDRADPVPVQGLDGVSSVGAGYYHTCASRLDGRVLCWGQNSEGALGSGQTANSLVPTATALPFQALRVDAGAWRSCATSTAGQTWCWGARIESDAGYADVDRQVPTWYRPLANVAALGVGSTSTCALLRDATVRCWGGNADGEVGDGTTIARASPVLVLTGVRQVEVGRGYGNSSGFACALLEDGTVWCWGANGWGQLGDRTTNDRGVPVQVAGLTGVAQIAAGSTHVCARMNDGTVQCWGGNASGQRGDGTTEARGYPTPVGGLAGAVQVVAGSAHTCVLLRNNAVYCWGCNETGELGDGSTEDRASPVRVRGFAATGGDGDFVPEMPTRQQVQAALAAVSDGVAVCGTGRAETIAVEAEFVSDGTVRSVGVPAPYATSPVRACIEGALRRARLAPFRRPRLRVAYPYHLRAAAPVRSVRVGTPTSVGTDERPPVVTSGVRAGTRFMLGLDLGTAFVPHEDEAQFIGGLRLEFRFMDAYPLSLFTLGTIASNGLAGGLGGLRWRVGGRRMADTVGLSMIFEAGGGFLTDVSRSRIQWSPGTTLGVGFNANFGESWGGLALVGRWIHDHDRAESTFAITGELTADFTERPPRPGRGVPQE